MCATMHMQLGACDHMCRTVLSATPSCRWLAICLHACFRLVSRLRTGTQGPIMYVEARLSPLLVEMLGGT